jgi:hypothetical protein
MSDEDGRTPLYERNSVLFVAGSVVALSLALLQPFLTPEWPATVLRFVGRPVVRFAGLLTGFGAVFVMGYVLGRRRRPYSGPLIRIDGQPAVSIQPPQPPPTLTIVDGLSTMAYYGPDLLVARAELVITPHGRAYVPVRGDLRMGSNAFSAATTLEVPGGKHPQASAIPSGHHGRVRSDFHVPKSIAPVGTRLTGELTLTDSAGETITRSVDFGTVPAAPPPPIRRTSPWLRPR